MKEIKGLKPSWRDLATAIKSKELEIRRMKALEKWLI